MDVNKTTHIGTAITNPTLTSLGKKTPLAIFTMKVKEYWVDRENQRKSRDNVIKFEALGAKAHWVKANVKVGRKFYIDGYTRSEEINGEQDFKIRIFHIDSVTSKEFNEGKGEGRRESLTKALNIVKSSDDLSIAKAKLEVLLSEL